MSGHVGAPQVVTYDLDPRTAAVVGIDFQRGFGHGFEPVPRADEAVAKFIRLARAWRAIAGTVVHVHTTYTTQRTPTGRLTDFVPGIAEALFEGSPMAAFYEDMVEEGDVLVPKTTFSAAVSSDLSAELAQRGLDMAIVGGLTTPICVQTTVDGLSMTGTKVCLVADACASQPIGSLTAEQAHDAAVERMRYLFAMVTTVEAVLDLIVAGATAR